MAAVMQSTLTMTPLGELRYGSVPEGELRTWLQACYKVGIPSELETPRIAGFDDDGHGPNVTRMEYLVIRDLDLKPLEEVQDDYDGGRQASTGRIVAYAEFKYHPMEEAKSDEHANEPTESTSGENDWKFLQPPPSVHNELRKHWDGVVEAVLERQFGGMHCFEVRGLSTLSPSHLRKGIASKLLSWIFPWADRLNVPVVLAATPPGYPLYLKHGFVPVGPNGGAIECNMAEWGGSGVHRHILMMRPPEKKQPALN
ncbi:hypothetical protein H2200_005834 [Cladophialophora chaetospira]|uniref:N-acetyltransferase domain-containing protein n=1 Tax=Cladophialophora chaetospira TaxID=386627 RepID=A0AA39CIS1_9EURO|nr:hypothetical protein H2200_005834 [Cladophialophora chaetospira]